MLYLSAFFQNFLHLINLKYKPYPIALIVSIIFLFQAQHVFCAQLTIEWDENIETDLAGYVIYYGTSSGNYSSSIDVGNVTHYTLTGLQEGLTYYFAVSAYDYSDNESGFSQELMYKLIPSNRSPDIPSKPSGPANGYLNSSYSYSTSSADPDEDPLTFQFDWGDGVTSSWASSSQTHSWASPGNYCVKAQAKDPSGAISGWSDCQNINIIEHTHTINASADSNGRISPSGTVTVTHGSNQTFSILPDSNYYILNVLVDSVSIGSVNAHTFENVTQGHTINASFARSNQPPVANAGADQSARVNDTVTLDGSGSSDADGDSLTFSWSFVSRPSGSSAALSSTSATKSSFGVDAAGSYVVQLIVNDGTASSPPDTVTVSAGNSPPTAAAGEDQTVAEGGTVRLSGVNSVDPDNNIDSYSWKQTQGPAITLTNASETDATFIAPVAGAGDVTLAFQLTVKDSEGLVDVDSCVVHVIQATVPDSDNDGVPDANDAFPLDPQETLDTDKDGIGNNADEDDDNDGMSDDWEKQYGLDPLWDDASEDADEDGFTNLDEFLAGTDPLIPAENAAPDPPEIRSPDNNEVVTITAVLEIGAFSDPNISDVHTETQWQIYRVSDSFCVLDITSASSLTSLRIPNLILNEDTAYQWQARFYDNHGTPSEWSEIAFFSTENGLVDLNNNGIPDHHEVDVTSDMDEDGKLDVDEDTIKCVKTNGGGTQMGVSFEGSDTVLEIESIVSEDLHAPVFADLQYLNQPEYFPFGLISFKLIVKQPGDQAEVRVFLSETATDDGIWYKFHPIEGIWQDFSANAEFSPDRRSVKLILEDGGIGDADGIANRIIVDPSGVGASDVSSASGAGGSSGSSNNAACLISSAAFGSSANHQIRILQIYRMIPNSAIILFLLIMITQGNLVLIIIRKISKN